MEGCRGTVFKLFRWGISFGELAFTRAGQTSAIATTSQTPASLELKKLHSALFSLAAEVRWTLVEFILFLEDLTL